MANFIEDEYVLRVCRPGSKETCRYLLMSPKGWECGKVILDLKDTLDKRVEQGLMKAKGDNCTGIENVTGAA